MVVIIQLGSRFIKILSHVMCQDCPGILFPIAQGNFDLESGFCTGGLRVCAGRIPAAHWSHREITFVQTHSK